VPSFGILGLGGGVAFLLGATLLFDMEAPGFELSMPLLLGTAVIGGGLMVLVMTMAVRAMRRPISVGEEIAAGSQVVVIEWIDGSGTVDYHGERWRAEGSGEFAPESEATVIGRNGLILMIEPTTSEG
jgi:membrane-bound serine protease (ClpP class)